jgi:probable HAF family extracellular repeat protein
LIASRYSRNSNGQFQDLGTLPGGSGGGSFGNGINDSGVVVGESGTGTAPYSAGFVYSNGIMSNLNNLVPAGSGFTITTAIAINDSGQIVAEATDTSGNEHAVLLNPVAGPTMTLTGFPTPTTAGVAHNITVTVDNPNGTPDTSYTGTVTFTSTDPQAVLPANYTFTAADQGTHTFSVTLKTAGSQSITVADTTNDSLIAIESGITVNPAAATHFNVSEFNPANNEEDSAYPNTPVDVYVFAMDPYGNIATGYTGTIHFSDSVSGATLPANFTFTASNAGYHAFIGVKFSKLGEQTLSVTDTHTSSITGSVAIDVTQPKRTLTLLASTSPALAIGIIPPDGDTDSSSSSATIGRKSLATGLD